MITMNNAKGKISVIVKVLGQKIWWEDVYAGNDIITSLDTVTALKHGNGLQYPKAPVLEKNRQNKSWRWKDTKIAYISLNTVSRYIHVVAKVL